MKINKPLIFKILYSILWVGLTIGFFVLWGFSAVERKKVGCKNLAIKIDEGDNKFFISKHDVINIIKANGYDTLYKKKLSNIDWIRLERSLEANPWIAQAEMFCTRNGDIKIEVEQRCPLMRIINKNGVGFYVDENGVPMSLSSTFTARVLIVTGNLSISDFGYKNPASAKRYDLVKLAKFLRANQFWDAQISQIDIDEKAELKMYPLYGNHVVDFGNTDYYEQKLQKLKTFYIEGLNKVGWNKYKIINVKYSNQVLAS